LRDQLIAEIHKLSDSESLTLWAHRRLSAKNTLTSEAAPAVEATYQAILAQSHSAIEVVEPQPFSEHSGLKPELTANNPADVVSETVQNEPNSEPASARNETTFPIQRASADAARPIWRSSRAGPVWSARAFLAMPIIFNLRKPDRSGAKSATNSLCRCAANIIKNFIAMVTNLPGEPICRSRRFQWRASFGQYRFKAAATPDGFQRPSI
jgi:hypothetical protein